MSSSPFLGINHVGIVAHDAAALARFYGDAAALRPWPALEKINLPGSGITLAGPNAGLRVLAGGPLPQRRAVSEAGITHLCFQSTAVDHLRESFTQAQAAFHCPLIDLGTGFLYCYARDTEHNVAELEGVMPVWADRTPWFAHVNVACADIARQSAFYGALFGTAATRSPRLAGDPRLDQIADLHGVELRMAWVAAGNMQIELIHYSQPTAQATTPHSTRRQAGAGGHAYVALETADLAAAAAHLLACGGSLAEAQPARDTVIAADPEGNPLWLLARDTLKQHGAAYSQLPQPDITARFAAARALRQGPA
jgi:catechol 2,3-dioxygenase-like lactoylglutathione lyase family enzyme